MTADRPRPYADVGLATCACHCARILLVPSRFLRENAFLVAAIALPLVVVGFFLLATAIPRWTVPLPSHDLLFTTGDHREPRRPVTLEVAVVDGRLEAIARPAAEHSHPPRLTLWRFDHQTLSVREIPITVPDLPAGEASRTLDVEALASHRILAESRAPDGYEVRRDDRSRPGFVGELFGMRRYNRDLSIERGGRVVRIEVPSRQDSWSSPTFLGWIVDGEAR